MSEIAIRAEGLAKRYRIGKAEEGHDTLIGGLLSLASRPVENLRKLSRLARFGEDEDDAEDVIWALRDVSFDVKEGEVVGIIGRNGAGKSTLLKILTRITTPTRGRAVIRGNVQSLLEVGTGFHKELTGRENVYLNGAVLGMPSSEITRKFDEIVEFSGVEKFIDTPVKRYSTGMRVRLAFSVAAHLEPEVLLVDEVLSVGDEEFQRKCLGKMDEVAGRGRTILFVSHNLQSITRLCERVVLMEGGRIRLDGRPTDVVRAYLSGEDESTGRWVRPEEDAPSEDVWMEAVQVLDRGRQPTTFVPSDERAFVEIRYRIERPVRDLVILMGLQDSVGNLLWVSYDTDAADLAGKVRPSGSYVSRCTIPPHVLRPGRYYLNACALIPGVRVLEFREQVLSFDVSSVGSHLDPTRSGLLAPLLEWEVERSDHSGFGGRRPAGSGLASLGEG